MTYDEQHEFIGRVGKAHRKAGDLFLETKKVQTTDSLSPGYWHLNWFDAIEASPNVIAMLKESYGPHHFSNFCSELVPNPEMTDKQIVFHFCLDDPMKRYKK